MVETGLLHNGHLICIVEARSALQLWEARVCIKVAHGVLGFPPSSERICLLLQNIFNHELLFTKDPW
jgi:hypothetical protein